MHKAVFVVPGSIDTRTGGSIYDRRMVDALRQRGWTVDVSELDASFPFPTPAACDHAAAVLASVTANTVTIIDGLALSVLPDLIEREAPRLRIAALVHLPVAADVGLDPATASRLETAERRALGAVQLVIVTGAATLGMLDKYPGTRQKTVVVEPGTDRAVLEGGSGASKGAALRLLAVGTLSPGKGHDTLLQALALVPCHDWYLTCAGSLARCPDTADRVRELVHSLGLQNRVSLVGDLDAAALSDCYRLADVFVLATRQETYGMAVAEALAHGLPVVSTTTGAIPDLVGRDAGIVVPPGNRDALADALSQVIGDAGLRARLAAGARRVADRLPTWDQAAERFATVLGSLETHG